MIRFAALLIVICLAPGCAERKYVPVSGRVTMDGEPLDDVEVRFQPTGGTLKNPNVGRGSKGFTDEDGSFVLKVNSKTPGAAPGPHQVFVSFKRGDTKRMPRIPPRYNRYSKLTFEVPPEGTNSANFELDSSQ